MAHKLPDLPYSYDALEPYYDEQTVRIHHDLHHKGYVDGLNKAEEALDRAREQDDYALVKHWEKELAFHGSGHILHTLFGTIWLQLGRRVQMESLSRELTWILVVWKALKNNSVQLLLR
jgi:superoxide dismutase